MTRQKLRRLVVWRRALPMTRVCVTCYTRPAVRAHDGWGSITRDDVMTDGCPRNASQKSRVPAAFRRGPETRRPRVTMTERSPQRDACVSLNAALAVSSISAP